MLIERGVVQSAFSPILGFRDIRDVGSTYPDNMAEDDSFSFVIEGGAPWGFRLQGGIEFRAPLRVAGVSLTLDTLVVTASTVEWTSDS